MTGFELYETYKPGALYRLSSTRDYVDDNTIACCGDGPSAEGMNGCSELPACSKATSWTPIWSGTARSTGDSANIFEPPVCPYAYKTATLRLDLDTSAATGWNNFDAAKLLGSVDLPPGQGTHYYSTHYYLSQDTHDYIRPVVPMPGYTLLA